MFAGKYNNSLDDKNRCIIPAKFRNDLGTSCMLVTSDFDDCLYLYTTEDWKRTAEERILSRPEEDQDAVDVRTSFFDNSYECEVDKQGRIKIHDDCVDYAGINKEMVNIGQINRIQIWSLENYTAKKEKIAPKRKELVAKMNKYNPAPKDK